MRRCRKRIDCRGLWRKEEKGRMDGRKKRGEEKGIKMNVNQDWGRGKKNKSSYVRKDKDREKGKKTDGKMRKTRQSRLGKTGREEEMRKTMTGSRKKREGSGRNKELSVKEAKRERRGSREEMERSLGEKRERRVVSTSECSSISIYPEMREVRARSLLFNH